MEASGVYHEKYALHLHKKGCRVSIVLPSKSNLYLKMIGESKNDKIDAKGLARMGAEQSLSKWEPASKYYLKLRDLTRYYEEVQDKRSVLSWFWLTVFNRGFEIVNNVHF